MVYIEGFSVNQHLFNIVSGYRVLPDSFHIMPDSLQIELRNQTSSSEVYAYVTGIAIQHDGKRCLLKADGKGLYFPESPSEIGSALAEDCAIPLGAPGNSVTVTIPQIAGGRLWITQDSKLTFLLNPGPALV